MRYIFKNAKDFQINCKIFFYQFYFADNEIVRIVITNIIK